MTDVRMPDGVVVRFPDNFTETQIRGIIASKYPRAIGEAGAAVPRGERDMSGHVNRDGGAMDKAGAFLTGAVEGMPIVGPTLEKGARAASARIGSALTGQDFGQVYDQMGQSVDQVQQDNPNTTMAGNVAGNVLGTLPAVAAAPTLFGAGGGSLAARSLLSGMTGGAIGGADAVARGQDPATGAGLGLAFGLAGPGAGQLIGSGMRKVAGAFGPKASQAQKTLSRFMSADGVDDVPAAMRDIGPDALPMDLGPNMQRLGGGLASLPGSAQQTVRSAVAERGMGAGGRTVSSLDNAMGETIDTFKTADDIIKARSAAAKPLYDAAYAKPVNYTVELEELLKRPSVGQALKKAQSLAADEGIPSQQWFAQIGDDGSVAIRQTPDMRQLDLTKRALDDMISAAQRGGNGNEARILTQTKNKLVDMMDAAAPEYAQARSAFSGPSSILDAMEEGRQVFKSGLSPNELRTRMLKMGDAEKEAFQQGSRSAVADIMGTARNDALAARSTFQKGYNKEKLDMIIGPDKSEQMLKELAAEGKYVQTRDVVTGNSETAARRAAQEAVGAGDQKSFIENLLNVGSPGTVVKTLGQGMTGRSKQAAQEASNAELAKLLTSRDPAQITRALKMVQSAQKRGEISEKVAKQIMQSVMVSGSNQTREQFLTQGR